jgi:hypothetical protein
MTDNDVQKLIEAMKPVFVTKEDVEAFPTAEMVLHGFEEMAKKADVDAQGAELRNDIKEVKDLLTSEYKRRVETLEKDVKDLKEALAM